MPPARRSRPARDGFRFANKRGFFTYPQCGDLTKERVLEFFRDDRGAQWYLVGLEKHQDGGNHIHAYIEWTRVCETSDPHHFDVDGRHPNIQSVRRPSAVVAYVKKDGDYIGNCEAHNNTTMRYGDIIRDAGGVDDFLGLVEAHHPRDLAINFSRLLEFARWRYPEQVAQYTPSYTSFVVPDDVLSWKADNLDVQVKI